MSDGIKNALTEAIQNPYAITSTFDSFKSFIAQIEYIIYIVGFAISFLLFIIIFYFLFLYLPFRLMKEISKNKSILKKLIRFDLSLFRFDISSEGVKTKVVKKRL